MSETGKMRKQLEDAGLLFPEPPKTGKWKVTSRGTRCPVCGQRTFQGLTPFCAWCGAALDGIVMEDKNGETDMGTPRPER